MTAYIVSVVPGVEIHDIRMLAQDLHGVPRIPNGVTLRIEARGQTKEFVGKFDPKSLAAYLQYVRETVPHVEFKFRKVVR